MNSRTAMARAASTFALRMRSTVQAKPWDAIDVFDLAKAAGVEVRFANISSMEGMYLRHASPIRLANNRQRSHLSFGDPFTV
jgi:hypothetical protein